MQGCHWPATPASAPSPPAVPQHLPLLPLLERRAQPRLPAVPAQPTTVLPVAPAPSISGRTVELYDPRRDAWSAGPVMPAPASFAAAAMLGGQLYVVEGAAHAPHVLSFHRRERHWGACQPLAKPRVNMAVCAVEDRLYVLVGGRAGASGQGLAGCAQSSIAPCSPTARQRARPLGQRGRMAGPLHEPAAPRLPACMPASHTQTSCRCARLPPLAGRPRGDRQGRVCAAGCGNLRSCHQLLVLWCPHGERGLLDWCLIGALPASPASFQSGLACRTASGRNKRHPAPAQRMQGNQPASPAPASLPCRSSRAPRWPLQRSAAAYMRWGDRARALAMQPVRAA